MAYAWIVMPDIWPGFEQTLDYRSKFRSNIENQEEYEIPSRSLLKDNFYKVITVVLIFVTIIWGMFRFQ